MGGPSRSLLEVRGAPWVALPTQIFSVEAASQSFKFEAESPVVRITFISLGFKRYVGHFRGASFIFSVLYCHGSFPDRVAGAGAAGGKRSQHHSSLWVFEVPLGTFGIEFCGFSVLHCHGGFLSGRPLLNGRCSRSSSSSRRKKELKSFFSMGFRSCVRYFRGTILKLLPPLLPWCFPIWEVLLEQKV